VALGKLEALGQEAVVAEKCPWPRTPGKVLTALSSGMPIRSVTRAT